MSDVSSPSMFAQALAEYGLLDKAVAGAERLFDDASLWVQDAGPGTWVILAVVGLVVFKFLRR